jgi:glycine hydroxymethyltransferase
MVDQFQKRGLRIPFGGTDSHMLNVDVTSIKGADGTALSGDQAARILDTVGIVVNRNTIPGDKNSLDPSGIRLGTPWITQRGFDVARSRKLADIIADVLLACAAHSVDTPHKGRQRRAKLDFNVLNDARLRVRELAASAGIDSKPTRHAYPHFHYVDDRIPGGVLEISGRRARQVLNYAL